MSVRTFIAVSIDEAVRRRLAELCAELARTPARVKWVRPDGIHLTLVFIGDVPEAMVPSLAGVVDATVEGESAFTLQVTGTGFFGRRRAPRVLWAGIRGDIDRLASIHVRLVEGLQALDLKIDDRPFSPHLTLGRVRGATHTRELLETLERHSEDDMGEIHADAIRLIKSELRPDGAVYETLHDAPLGSREDLP